MDGLFAGIFASTGQICMNAKRIYVHSSKKQELIEELAKRLEQVKLGPASDPETTMGPLHQTPHWHYVTRSEEHTSELQSRGQLVCRLLLEKKIVIKIEQ